MRAGLKIIKLLPLTIWIAMTAACTHSPVDQQPAKTGCANIDWYESGRSDGVLGYPISKLDQFQSRCNGTPNPVQTEFYLNGREAGLVDFCSVTGGLEAGKSSIPYEKVCPENLEPVFLANYELGLRIHKLETENADLESRIDNLVALLPPSQTGGSVRAQIDQLKSRRALINSEISTLETKAGSM